MHTIIKFCHRPIPQYSLPLTRFHQPMLQPVATKIQQRYHSTTNTNVMRLEDIKHHINKGNYWYVIAIIGTLGIFYIWDKTNSEILKKEQEKQEMDEKELFSEIKKMMSWCFNHYIQNHNKFGLESRLNTLFIHAISICNIRDFEYDDGQTKFQILKKTDIQKCNEGVLHYNLIKIYFFQDFLHYTLTINGTINNYNIFEGNFIYKDTKTKKETIFQIKKFEVYIIS